MSQSCGDTDCYLGGTSQFLLPFQSDCSSFKRTVFSDPGGANVFLGTEHDQKLQASSPCVQSLGCNLSFISVRISILSMWNLSVLG